MTISDLLMVLQTDDLRKDFSAKDLHDAIDYIDAVEQNIREYTEKEMREFEPELYTF